MNNDRVEFKAGFEQRIAERFNFAVEVMGTHDVNNSETITLSGSTIIYDHLDGQIRERAVDLSNIPNRANDNIIDASAGLRFAPSDRFAILGNLLVPLNDGGLRASFVPTIGLSMNF